jgi:glycogen operon protein
VAIHIDGSKVGDDRFLLLVNAYWENVDFEVPAAAPGKKWARIVDTSNRFEGRDNFWQPNAADVVPAGGYRTDARTMVVLQEIDV